MKHKLSHSKRPSLLAVFGQLSTQEQLALIGLLLTICSSLLAADFKLPGYAVTLLVIIAAVGKTLRDILRGRAEAEQQAEARGHEAGYAQAVSDAAPAVPDRIIVPDPTVVEGER